MNRSTVTLVAGTFSKAIETFHNSIISMTLHFMFAELLKCAGEIILLSQVTCDKYFYTQDIFDAFSDTQKS